MALLTLCWLMVFNSLAIFLKFRWRIVDKFHWRIVVGFFFFVLERADQGRHWGTSLSPTLPWGCPFQSHLQTIQTSRPSARRGTGCEARWRWMGPWLLSLPFPLGPWWRWHRCSCGWSVIWVGEISWLKQLVIFGRSDCVLSARVGHGQITYSFVFSRSTERLKFHRQ